MRTPLLALLLLVSGTGFAQTRCDSIAALLDQSRDEVRSLMIARERAAMRMDEHVAKLDQEMETLRTNMKGYIDTIDSLKTANRELRRALDEKK